MNYINRKNRIQYKNKKIFSKRKKIKVKPRFFLFILTFITIILFYKLIKKDKYINYIEERKKYYQDYHLQKNINYAVNNFVFDYYEIENYSLKKTKNLNVFDKNKLTLKTLTTIELEKYFEKNKIYKDSFSLSVNLFKGEEVYSNNSEKIFDYYGARSLLTGMAIYDSLNKGIIKRDELIQLSQSNYSINSKYMDSSQIGNHFDINTIIEWGIRKEDPVSLNMLEDLLFQKYQIGISKIYNNLLGINYVDYEMSVLDTIKIVKSMHEKREVYLDLIKRNSENYEDLFLKSIYSEKGTYNEFKIGDSYLYDFGFIDGENPYIYSLYSDTLSKDNFKDIGDIINRVIEEYTSRKKIYK